MKKTIIIIALGFSLGIVSCNDAVKKDMGNAQENLKEAGKDMPSATKEDAAAEKEKAVADWKTFKDDSEKAIAAMEDEVKNAEAKIYKANKKESAALKADLIKNRERLDGLKKQLKDQNMAFEKEVSKFDAAAKAKNEAFKKEFEHDMDGLNTAIKDLFKNNVD